MKTCHVLMQRKGQSTNSRNLLHDKTNYTTDRILWHEGLKVAVARAGVRSRWQSPPTTGKRKHVGAIVIFTKQFHQFPGWRFAI
jgi:hypothetical protein